MRSVYFILILIFFGIKAIGQGIVAPELIRVTVDPLTQNVHIYWSPSDTPEVEYYLVSKWIITGNNPVPSGEPIASSKTYADEELHFSYYDPDVLQKTVGYSVRAYIESTDQKSDFSNIDSTIYLQAQFDSCQAGISLSWTDYNTWRNNISAYKIYGSTDGISYSIFDQVNEETNQVTINNIAANHVYRFYIQALRNNPRNDTSSSNRVDLDTRMAVNPDFLHADYATVQSSKPFVRFSVDPESELTNYVLMRSDMPEGPYDSIFSTQTNDKYIEYTDQADATQQPYYYNLKTINNCGQAIRTSQNIASTILLQTLIEGINPVLNWSAYQNWLGGVASYQIERKLFNENYEEIGAVNNLTYIDNFFSNAQSNTVGSEVCYQIVAQEGPGNPYGLQSSSSSNEVCINLPINIRFDFNAFVPGSNDNGTFGPAMDFIPRTFRFKIFNRWGTMVFESNNPENSRWDGIYMNNIVPEGVYRYQLEYKNESGGMVVLHGNVSIVYP